MDLAEMQFRAAEPDARDLWQADTRAYRDLLVALLTAPVPTLAAVQGPAVAGGLGLVAGCDLVLAADAATFALPEPQRGITAAIVAPLLVHRVGPGAAGYLLLSGRRWTAGEAQRAGLCHELCPGDQFTERRDELIESVLRGGPSALRLTKRHLLETAGRHLVAEIDAAMQLSAQAREGDEAREGLSAFLERRSPVWFPAQP
jgi:methylglutaconyl-CoA hydratase